MNTTLSPPHDAMMLSLNGFCETHLMRFACPRNSDSTVPSLSAVIFVSLIVWSELDVSSFVSFDEKSRPNTAF